GEPSLVVMLTNLTREFETVSRVPVTLAVEGEQCPVPAPVAAALYRIAQESLANIFKHAQARHVAVALAFLAQAIRLTITADGRGLPEHLDGGHGLKNMANRYEELGGRCRRARGPDGGTWMPVRIPAG